MARKTLGVYGMAENRVMPGKRECHHTVAAIDFGTTFSGYAFSTKHDFEKDPLKIYAHQWGKALISLKTPTCVLFDENKKFHSFGFEAEDKFSSLTQNNEHHDWFFFRKFKMVLYRDMNISKATKLEDEQGNKMLALTVFAESIKYLKSHLIGKYEERVKMKCLGEDILWVLTVPAIWNDKAKSFMREAAKEAGIVGNELVLALEPEAAAVFCKHTPVKMAKKDDKKRIGTFDPGSKYLVLDAGGGTMDITVHEVTRNNKMKELHKANGGDWGGAKVDEAFVQFLSEICGKGVIQTFEMQCRNDMLELLREFEIKKKTLSQESDEKVTFKIPASLNKIFTAQNPGKEIKDALISIPKYSSSVTFSGDKVRVQPQIAKTLFRSSVNAVVEHLKKMYHTPAVKTIDFILMVGGFSESPMLQQAVKAAFEPKVRVIIPNEAGLAVLKGAVIFGHKQSVIETRICKYTYGISCSRKFEDGVHPENKKFYTKDGEAHCRDIFLKVVEEGTEIVCGKSQKPKTLTPLEADDKEFTSKIVASDSKHPQFITDTGCVVLGNIVIAMPDTSRGLDRAVNYTLTFGDTELKVEAKDRDSDRAVTAEFKLLENKWPMFSGES